MNGISIQFVFSFLVGMIVGTILFTTKKSRRTIIIGSLLTSLCALVIVVWMANRPAPSIDITIDIPENGTNVELSTMVQGKVSSTSANVYALVHPLTTNSWWVQNEPLVQNDGSWQVLVYTGTETQGIGDSYEILALATDENSFLRLLRGDYPTPGEELSKIPPYLAKSNIIIVNRDK